MNEAVDGCHGGHGILEDLVPLGEDQVGGDDDALSFVALGQELEKDFHFLAGLLDIADVIEDDGVKALELGRWPAAANGRAWRRAVGRRA